MPKVVVLPHDDVCPEGAVLEVPRGDSLINNLLNNGIALEHACEMSCACTTCHVIVREGFDSLAQADDLEEDMLDKAWGLEEESRLGCQVVLGDEDLVIEIPKYNINIVSEHG